MSHEHLLPVSTFNHAFSTSDCLSSRVSCIPLDDKSLGVHRVTSRTSHRKVKPPHSQDPNDSHPPSEAWEAFYSKGSINPSAPLPGGFGFYLSGPADFVRALARDNIREAVLSYRVMFEDGFDFVKGGKMPGVFGGLCDSAYGCTGGRQEDRSSCFNFRLMWRANGIGELYAYVPKTENNKTQLLAVPPHSTENADYGFSVGCGAFALACGRWISVAIRVKVGTDDGEIALWIDGKTVISVKGLTLPGKVKGMHFQTFFGGHSPDWASNKDQRAWFADITGAIVEKA